MYEKIKNKAADDKKILILFIILFIFNIAFYFNLFAYMVIIKSLTLQFCMI